MTTSRVCNITTSAASMLYHTVFGRSFGRRAPTVIRDHGVLLLHRQIFTFYHWPCQAEAGEKPYCKTQTSLWYSPGKNSITGKRFELQDWGWTEHVNYTKDLQEKTIDLKRMTTPSSRGREALLGASCGQLLTKFKLCLGSNSRPGVKGESLPDGFPAERPISDYLRQLSIFFIVESMSRFGRHIQKCSNLQSLKRNIDSKLQS